MKPERETVLLSLNKKLLVKVDKLISESHEWTTRQEFLREGIRRLIDKKEGNNHE